ncbi:3-hydroxyacyl-ACP dehydratase FabZ family protein [Lonsdalea quercina]|uniref:3-hydroxyacyl-ACP dehydratase FabZ family protein n=1 Tax=Lonsdalea quercina TaxID=71657 RepID=UPI0039752BA0
MQIDTQNNIGMIGGNPHRFPMVLVDRIIQNDSKVITEKFVSLNDYEFRHANFTNLHEFVYPEWLVVESFFQSAGLFLNCSERDLSPYVISCKNVHFQRAIVAGEIIQHHVFIDVQKDSFIIVSGESKVSEETVVSYQQVWLGFQQRETQHG